MQKAIIELFHEAAGILGICQISLVERLCDRISAEHIDTVEILRHVIGEIERRYQFVNRALRSPQCFLVAFQSAASYATLASFRYVKKISYITTTSPLRFA